MERIRLNIQKFAANNTVEVEVIAAVNKLEASLNSATKTLGVLRKEITKTKDETGGLKNAAQSLGSSFSGFGKGLANTFNNAKRIINRFYSDFLTKSVDTSEELNLFNVVFNNIQRNGKTTFSELGKEATKFQNKLNEAFGTNKKETMRYQGLFQAMGESAGLDDKTAALMSENMTKLAYDLASLYNTTETKAAESLRAGVYAGQTKPLRNYGIDVTQTSFKPLMQELGLEKSVNELTQAEKEILRYITTLRQAQNAMGDFANTIESPANQLKVLKQQFYEMQVAIGNLFVGAFARILPYVNAIVMVIKEVARAIASFFGIEMSDYNTGIASYAEALEDYEDGLDGIGGSAGSASKAIKELKRQTLGFDQINNLVSPTPKSSSSGGGGGGAGVSGGIDKRLLEALSGYENGMEQVRMKATEIRDKIMEWLGFTKEVDEETGEVNFKLKSGFTRIKAIGALIGGAVVLGALKKVVDKIIDMYDWFKKVKVLVDELGKSKFFTNFSDGSVLKGLGYLAAIAAAVYGNVEIGKSTNRVTKAATKGEKITGKTVFGKDLPQKWSDWNAKDYGKAGLTSAMTGSALVDPFGITRSIAGTVAAWDIGKSIKDNGFKETMKNINKTIEETFGIDIYGKYLKPAEDAFWNFCWKIAFWIEDLKAKISGTWEAIKTTTTNIWNSITGWIKDNVVEPIKQFFEPLGNWFKSLWESISQTAQDIWNNITGFISGCVETARLLWGEFTKWLDENIIAPVTKSFSDLWNSVKNFATDAWNKVKEVWGIVTTWFEQNVVNPVKNAFNNIWGSIKNGASAAWEGIKNVFNPVVNWFRDKFTQAWTAVKNIFSTGGQIFTGIKEGIEKTFKTVVNGIIRGINTIISKPFNAINNVIGKLKSISIAGAKPFENKLSYISIPQIPLMANGGMPSTGQLFIANEAGPELVGQIGNKTAVANNDQIIKGIEKGVYNAVTNAMNNGSFGGFELVAHTDEGVVIDRINRITRQTGECPIEI